MNKRVFVLSLCINFLWNHLNAVKGFSNCNLSTSIAFRQSRVSPQLLFNLPSSSQQRSADVIKNSSNELLALLVEQYNANEKSSSASLIETERIEYLMQILIESKAKFDPNKCIFGDFFATVYFSGPTPLWEKLSRSRSKNIKGQKIFKDDKGKGRVVNYAEVFGKTLQLRAYGTLEKSVKMDDNSVKAVSGFSPKDAIVSFLGNAAINGKPSWVQCPVDYTATVQMGTIVCLGWEVDIAINGVGIQRVLYADEKVRIFVSVDNSTTSNIWEDGGLYAVQVRSDLIDPSIIV